MNLPKDRLHQACDWLADQRHEMTNQLITWSEIASGSHDLAGLQRMSDQLQADWLQHGFMLDRVALPVIEDVNMRGEILHWNTVNALIARRRPQASRRVLLAIHFDTVYEFDSPFKSCQWIDRTRLRGPGVTDAKGGLVVMLWALAAIEKFQLAAEIGWTAILNPDEEIGSPASASLFQKEAAKHDFGVLFEPCLPDGALVSQRKGSGNFTIVVHGRAAHAGRQHQLGRNAIVMLSKIVAKISELNDVDRGLTVNVGRFEGGGPLNQVPDLAAVKLNARVADSAVQLSFEQSLQSIVDAANQNEGYQVQLHGRFHAPPRIVDEPMRSVQRAVEAAQDATDQAVRWQATGGACDGNKLAFYGLPNVDTLGPLGDDLHSPKEWVDTSTLVSKALLVVRLLTNENMRRGD